MIKKGEIEMSKIDKLKIEDRLFEYDSEHKIYCTNPYCNGHGIAFKRGDKDRLICVNCGHWIYKDEKTKLKYEMKERGINVK